MLSQTSQLNKHLDYMYALERFGIKLGLEVMEQLLAALGNPHQAFKSIHITGTNGKGSTASFMAHALYETGQKVGLYTSPHLDRFNERIRINHGPITDERLVELIMEVKKAADHQKLQPTFFEFTTALAFLFFARQHVDIAVIEVGMGGTLDATNVITPLVAIITNVGLDHTPMIGRNTREIAINKAGIIKHGGIVVTAERQPEILKIFERVCEENQATLYPVHEVLKAEIVEASLDGQVFKIIPSPRIGEGEDEVRTNTSPPPSPILGEGEFGIPLLGAHQIDNACTALLALKLLEKRGISISDKAICAGFRKTTWPGRLDIVSRQPFILVDGAHNADGVRSLHAFLTTTDLPTPEVLILALKRDKDPRDMLEKIVPRFKHMIITQGNYEPKPAEELAGLIRLRHSNVRAISDVTEAIAAGLKKLSPHGMMLITGSLYMIGDALIALRDTLKLR